MHESHNAPEATVTAATEVEGFPGRYARSFYCHILQHALVRCFLFFFYTSKYIVTSYFLILFVVINQIIRQTNRCTMDNGDLTRCGERMILSQCSNVIIS